ncbi:hypothetical protein I4F81_008238 [Pyropia yezoensis]|uniref:Uncharacterized protein n=1 Tax=Pyropia yezoensis TaxID=2788 RepID=A0ACC3C6D4_PYRYE|nr:hypothetical protein I4F81_008238 [Neopyropia yezoensis]
MAAAAAAAAGTTTAFVAPTSLAGVRATSWAGAAVCSPAAAGGAAAAAAAGTAMAAEPYASSSSPVRVPVPPPPPAVEPESVETPKSHAVPFMKKPEGLIDSQDGFTGFDPFFISNWLDQAWAAKGELKNGRVAMLACVGWFVAEFVHLPHPRLANPVALEAARDIPRGLWATIIICISLVEILTFPKMLESDRRAGDLDFDPLKLDSPAMRLREVKHGRLAMLSILALVIQQSNVHKPTIGALLGTL